MTKATATTKAEIIQRLRDVARRNVVIARQNGLKTVAEIREFHRRNPDPDLAALIDADEEIQQAMIDDILRQLRTMSQTELRRLRKIIGDDELFDSFVNRNVATTRRRRPNVR
jgi:hypothetical protein